MSRLTDEQLITLENLTGIEYTRAGKPRKTPRSNSERYEIGFMIKVNGRYELIDEKIKFYEKLLDLPASGIETLGIGNWLKAELQLKQYETKVDELHGMTITHFNKFGEYRAKYKPKPELGAYMTKDMLEKQELERVFERMKDKVIRT